MVLQKVQYCTNLYKRIPSSAKTIWIFTFCTVIFVLKFHIAHKQPPCGIPALIGFIVNFYYPIMI
ncbi:hypothetical protein BpHYR1_040762 [Brachionus plicatilis]|uniref:Uncharacterized protein n=1 Tax=Brachionus plicatilis TaxID=10195 RepID=A0A3M7PRV6_BRAPC|nr:hypothetical protein BpHYR1_040762 [Brachionus plicatilis]